MKEDNSHEAVPMEEEIAEQYSQNRAVWLPTLLLSEQEAQMWETGKVTKGRWDGRGFREGFINHSIRFTKTALKEPGEAKKLDIGTDVKFLQTWDDKVKKFVAFYVEVADTSGAQYREEGSTTFSPARDHSGSSTPRRNGTGGTTSPNSCNKKLVSRAPRNICGGSNGRRRQGNQMRWVPKVAQREAQELFAPQRDGWEVWQ